MIGKLLTTSLVTVTALAQAVSASSVVAYWGQNSGGDQDRLATYCTDSNIDIVVLSFLSGYPNLELNFANQCGLTFPDGLLHCSAIGEDIKTCQAAGKKVLLSLGGFNGAYGFSDDAEATAFASTLWNKFGAGTDDSERPFDDAVVDGFDIDSENHDQTGYVALGKELKALYASDSSKQYYLSASPQCVYPDQSVGDFISQVDVDYTFVQFYNNPCSLDGTFNWGAWSDFAKSKANPPKIFVGLAAAQKSAGAGYVDASVVAQNLNTFACDPNFGGISLWDASSAFGNTNAAGVNYVDQIKAILASANCAAPSSAAPVAPAAPSSSVPVSSAGPYTNGSITAAPVYTATKTNIETTLVTITSCSDHKCSLVTKETGLTTITNLYTSFVTYCPLSGQTTTTVTPAAPATVAPVAVPSSSAPAAVAPAASIITSAAVPVQADVYSTLVVNLTAYVTGASTVAPVYTVSQGAANTHVLSAWALVVSGVLAALF